MESRDDAMLSARLAALPLETPPERGWSELAARIADIRSAPARRRTAAAWLALAAGFAAVGLFVSIWQRQLPSPELAAPTLNPIGALVQRSQALESEIRRLRANAPDVDEMRYAWESAVESDLAVVDARLAVATEPSIPLWRERVRLLEELQVATQTDTGSVLLQARLD